MQLGHPSASAKPRIAVRRSSGQTTWACSRITAFRCLAVAAPVFLRGVTHGNVMAHRQAHHSERALVGSLRRVTQRDSRGRYPLVLVLNGPLRCFAGFRGVLGASMSRIPQEGVSVVKVSLPVPVPSFTLRSGIAFGARPRSWSLVARGEVKRSARRCLTLSPRASLSLSSLSRLTLGVSLEERGAGSLLGPCGSLGLCM